MKKHLQKGNALPIVLIVVALLLVGGALFYTTNKDTEVTEEVMVEETIIEEETMEKEDTSMGEVMEDEMVKEIDKAMATDMVTMEYTQTGELADVTEGDSTGTASATFADGTYSLYATFSDLPEPEGTDFYEGWIVRKGDDISVISTGRVDMVDNKYANIYSSGQDLTDHTFYVLTIEPDDGNPAPAAHVLEGTMVVSTE